MASLRVLTHVSVYVTSQNKQESAVERRLGWGRGWPGAGTSGDVARVPHADQGVGYAGVQLPEPTKNHSLSFVHFIVRGFRLLRRNMRSE